MSPRGPRYIAVEGPIGVGKTSLARRLADTFQAELLLEQPEQNPFLRRFYRNPRQVALPTQLHFLLQRAQQVMELRQGDLFQPALVADFMVDKDPLFARATLDEEELKLYEQLYRHVTVDAPEPDLVIYLQAPVQVLLERITRRGVDYERAIDAGYLQRVVDAYTGFFHDFVAAPLLIINAAEIDFVTNERDYQTLVEQIQAIRGGRHYFNPLPFDT